MSWFARIANNNIVEQVMFVAEQYGEDGESWCSQNYGGNWKETFENGRFRKRFAVVGYVYDKNTDEFIFPKPFPSWIWSDENQSWVAPIQPPQDGKRYRWIEETAQWELSKAEE